jgi:hypothetical protein
MAQAVASIIISAQAASAAAAGTAAFSTFTVAAISTAAALTDLAMVAAYQNKKANDARKDAARAPRDVTIRSAVEPARIIYGKARTSGPVVYTNTVLTTGTSDNSTLWTVISLANHECQSIEEIWLDGDQIDFTALSGTGGVQSGKYGPIGSNEVTNFYAKLGEDSQGAISALTSAFSDWTASHRGNNVTYIASAFELGTATGEGVWSQGAPRNIRAVVKGKKVYDPRLDSTQTGGSGSHRLADPTTWEWSDNPALCLADYLFDDRLGMGAEGVTYNDIDWDMVADAADDCDATVTIPGGSEKRFTCNGVLSTGNTYAENVKSILSSMNGMMTWSGGKYRIRACAHEAASYTFTRDDIVGDVQIQPERTRSQRFNSVRGTYIDPDSDYNTVEFIPVTIDDYKTDRDNGESLYTNIGLPMTNSEYMAQRIAFKSVNLNNQQLTAVIPMNWRAMKVGVGDRITLNMSELFGSRTTFIVQNWSFEPDKGFVLTVREDASSAYNDPASDEYSTRTLGGTVSFADQPVSAPSNLSATSEEEAILVEWTAPPRGSGYDEVVVYASANSSWSSASEVARTRSTSFRHELSNGTQRYYWVRSIDVDGEVSTRDPDSDTSTIQATAGQINTSQLNDDDNFALTADWPSVTDSQGTAPDDNATNNGSTINTDGDIAGSIDTATTGDIHGGQTGYDSGTGYFLGYDTNAYKFSIGNSSGDKLTFDGSNLAVTGNITADGGSIGGLTIGSDKIYLGTGTFNNTNTGFYIDDTGQFSLKDKLAFYPTDNTLRVKGNIEADVITVNSNLQVVGDLQASSLAIASITREMFTQDALDEIYGALATAVGGSNGDYQEASGSFTTSGGTVTLALFDHGESDVAVEWLENYGFSQTTDYTGTALQATLTFEASTTSNFATIAASKTETITLGKYDLSSYYGSTYIWYYGPRSVTKTFTTSDLADNTDYYFRVRVTNVGSAFTGQTYPFELEANEGVTGVVSTGGNADTLDNLDSTAFLRSNVDDTFDANLTVTGNLTVQGTTVTLNTATLDVEDKNITLNYGAGDTSGSANGAGITIQDAVNSSTDATILWDATNDEFDFSHPINVGTLYAGNVQATGSIGNLTAGSLGQQMEKGDTSVTTLRFDADRWRLYAGNNAGEMISAYENGNVDFTTGNLLKNGTSWMDNSRNMSNLGTISSGAITSTGTSAFGNFRLTDASKMGFGMVKAGGSVAHTATVDEGIFWHTGNDYGIYRTSGAWSSPNYQQLKIKFITGIELDGGSAYGKSGVNIINSDLQIGGTTVIDSARNISAADLTVSGTLSGNFNLSTSQNLTVSGSISGGSLTAFASGTPTITLNDIGSGGGGAASGKIIFANTSGDAIGIGYTGNSTGDSDLIISTNAAGTYGGFLGLDSAAIADSQADIILEPKSNVRIATGSLEMGTVVVMDSSRNLQSIGTISSGAITSSGNLNLTNGNITSVTGSQDLGVLTTSQTEANLYLRSSNASAGNRTNLYFAPANNVATGLVRVESTEDATTTANRSSKMQFWVRENGNWRTPVTIDPDEAVKLSGRIGINGKDDANAQLAIGDTGVWRIRESGNDMYLMDPISSLNSRVLYLRNTGSGALMHVDMNGNFRMNGTTVIDSSRVLQNVTHPTVFINRQSYAGSGISWYSSGYRSWATYMAQASQTNVGPTANITAPSGTLVTSWALRNFIENYGGYGWTFESGSGSSGQPSVVAEIRASDGSARFGGAVNAVLGYQVNGTTVIDSSRNLTNITTLSVGGSQSGSANSIFGTNQYALTVQASGSNATATYNDTLLVKNNNYSSSSVAGQKAQIGFVTVDGDGDHHRAQIIGKRDTSGGTAGGKLELLTRTGGGSPAVALTLRHNKTAEFASSISASGTISTTGDLSVNDNASGNYYLYLKKAVGGDGHLLFQEGQSLRWQNSATTDLNWYSYTAAATTFQLQGSGGANLIVGDYKINGTTVIDSSRNLTNIVGISATGAIRTTGGSTTGFYLNNSGNHSDGLPYARLTEAWGMSFTPPDARWAPNVQGASFLVGLISNGSNFGSGNILATGNITAYYSDERLKTRLGNIDNALEKVCSLDGFRYVNNDLAKSFGYDKDEPQLGLSAQQVQAVAPETVSLAPFDMTGDNDPDGDGKIYSKSGEDYLTVDYSRLVPLLVEAIKELKYEVESLKSQLKENQNGDH